MSIFIQIQEKITFLKQLLTKNSEGFQDKKIVWQYLEKLDLNDEEKNILTSAFRTRIKLEVDTQIFQFRISPSSLSDSQKENISNISEQLKDQLQKLIPAKIIEVQIKISDCCGKNCYGCSTFVSK